MQHKKKFVVITPHYGDIVVTEDQIKEFVAVRDKVRSPDFVKFYHINNSRFARISFATRVADGNLYVGWSSCSERDNFCRATAREIAEKRLNNDPIIIPLDGEFGDQHSDVAAIRRYVLVQYTQGHTTYRRYACDDELRQWCIEHSRLAR